MGRHTKAIVVGLFVAALGVGLTGVAAADHVGGETDDCSWWQECEDDVPGGTDENSDGTEDDFACEEPEWRDADDECDEWSDPDEAVGGGDDATPPSDQEHPVEEAVFFTWFDGDDPLGRVDAGPMACIDTSQVGGVTEVTPYADEYAELIMDEANSPLWEEYSSESNIALQIDKHYLGQYLGMVEGEEVICSSVWENAIGSNDERPADAHSKWEWNDPDDRDN